MGSIIGGSGNHSAIFMIIGWWSEFRVVIGAETIAKSGEKLGPVRGILVGSSSLRRASSLLLRRLAMVVPREHAWLYAIWENQQGL